VRASICDIGGVASIFEGECKIELVSWFETDMKFCVGRFEVESEFVAVMKWGLTYLLS
jgi:hypothetical protein